MRVVVFGASGRTGRHLVEGALARGHEVTAFARDASGVEKRGEGVSVVEGNVMDPEPVEEAVAGQDAVLCALGHVKGSPGDVQTEGTRNIVAAMKEHGVRRIVSLTGAGVAAPGDEPKFVDRAIVGLMRRLQPAMLADAERHAKIIRESGLEWVVVRGPRLTDGSRTGKYRVGAVGRSSGIKVSRADIADFMLAQLERDDHLGSMPVVSY